MEQLIISIRWQIMIVVALSFLAGVITGCWAAVISYKSKYDYEATREFFKRKPLYDWHTTIPCPGAFLICEIADNRLIYGYAVSLDDEVGIMQIPDRVGVMDKHVLTRIIPFKGVIKWSYAEDHPIYPVETLKPYSQSYKSN